MKDAKNTNLNSVKTICPKITSNELDYIESGLKISELEPKDFYISEI
jgi:hypothetical protein